MPSSRVHNSASPTTISRASRASAAFKAALRPRSSRCSASSSSLSHGRYYHNDVPLIVPLLLAALLMPRAVDAACSRVRQVVVVGAGMSGVSAAYRIVTATGGECFNVLSPLFPFSEAQERIFHLYLFSLPPHPLSSPRPSFLPPSGDAGGRMGCWSLADSRRMSSFLICFPPFPPPLPPPGYGGGSVRQGGLGSCIWALSASDLYYLPQPNPSFLPFPLPPGDGGGGARQVFSSLFPSPVPPPYSGDGGGGARQVFSSLFPSPVPPPYSGDSGGGARKGGRAHVEPSLISSACLFPHFPPFPQVTVVEARGRVGGRMWSRTEAAPAGSPTTFLRGEMGAQWIEGATGNPVTTLARKFKLNIAQQNGREIQFTAKGRQYGDAEWAAAEAEYQTLVRQALSWAGKQNKDVSLQQAFTSGPWKRKMFYKPYAQSRLAVDYEFNFGTALSHLSAWYYDSDAFDPPTMVVTNGYDNIPKMLMQSSMGVQITGKNTATGATGTLDADVVIVTIPLGVLKANTIAFSPSLPPRKTGAISRLGVGAIAKIFFFFNQTFWPVKVDEYFIEDSQLPANRGRWVDWVNLKRAWGQTALEGVALGEYAERMAKMSDEEVISDAKAKMARMFPQYRKKPLEPLATWIQRWTAEPYSRGAYSYARVGVRGNEDHCTDYDVMALPEGRVLFAGEHTIWQYQATVHGALLSGVREAKRVLKNF
ncbi:unnamed protein product [Closterium sp. NIES-53]